MKKKLEIDKTCGSLIRFLIKSTLAYILAFFYLYAPLNLGRILSCSYMKSGNLVIHIEGSNGPEHDYFSRYSNKEDSSILL